MAEAFRIVPDDARKLVRLTLTGLWDLTTAQQFDRALRDVFTSFHIQPFDVIANLRDWPVQTQETTAVHEALMAFGKSQGMRRSAIVTASTLGKMQVLRAANSESFRAFESEAEAEAWIASFGS